MKNTYVSIETVIQGSNEEPIDFKCRSITQAMRLRSTLAAAPIMLAALERVMQLQVSTKGDEVFKQVRDAIVKATGVKNR